MKTFLVLAQNPELPGAVQSALEGYACRILIRPGLEDAEPLLRSGPLDACLIDADQPQVQLVWLTEQVRDVAPRLPILVFASVRAPEWEETLYLRGVRQILAKPVRPRLLRTLLDRLEPATLPTAVPPAPWRPSFPTLAPSAGSVAADSSPVPPVLRHLGAALPHAHSQEELFEHILPTLREWLGVQRVLVFVRPAFSVESGSSTLSETRKLNLLRAIGASTRRIGHFNLSLDQGVGALLSGGSPILRRTDGTLSQDPSAAQEMLLLGAETLVALTHDDAVVGALALGPRLDGAALSQATLQQLYFLGENLAQAVTQIWSVDRVAASHAMMTNILRELNSACVVVGRDLKVLHANQAARSLFLEGADGSSPLGFQDLPQALANRVYQVLRTGSAGQPFRHRDESSGRQFQASIVPFQGHEVLLPVSALLVLEDQTQSEQLRRLEVEAANLRLVRTMADRLAHEIGNALVPISTHQQLLPTRHKDPEFRASLESSLASSVKRIARLVNQMVFLAQDRPVTVERLPLPPLIDEAFREAQRQLVIQTAVLKQHNDVESSSVLGDHEALKHALTEIFINAIQANPQEARVAVRTGETTDEDGTSWILVEILDQGDGFTSEAVAQATEAFFTTRSVGLGLGLTVARKVIEMHQGRMQILVREGDRGGMVRVLLPKDPSLT